MNLFKGKTITARLIIAFLFCVIYTALAYYLLTKYLINDRLYYLYFAAVTALLILIYSGVIFIIYKTVVKPIKEILHYAGSVKNNTNEKHNLRKYYDLNIEQLNVSYNELNGQVQVIKDANKKYIESVVKSSLKPLEDSKVILEKAVSGANISGKAAKDTLEEVNRCIVKLNLFKEIAMIDSGYYSAARENINIISAINDCIYTRQEHILRKKLNVEYDFSNDNIFGKTDENAFKKIIGAIFDVCILQLVEQGTFRIIINGNEGGFDIRIQTDTQVVSKTQNLTLINDYTIEDADNIIILKLLLAKKLSKLIGITFITDTNNDGVTVFNFYN